MDTMTRSTTAYPWTIDPFEPGEPKWRSIYGSIRRRITDGQIVGGTQLPSTRDLAQHLRVARGTIAQAYELLLAEGFVVGEIGRGTFVVEGFGTAPHLSEGAKRTAFRRPGRLLSERGTLMAQSPYSLAASSPRAVPFTPYLPALSEFPLATWGRLSIATARQLSVAGLRDGDAQGYEPLRQTLKHYLRVSRGIRCDAGQIFLFSSTMQALDICLRLFTDEGDLVGCEDPCYRGALALFKANRVEILPIQVDTQGMRSADLANSRSVPKLVYTTPAHQAPLGSIMSARRRRDLLEWAKVTGSIIFEDDYDGEFRYGGHSISTLQADDEGGLVFHGGSFSKTLFPALRISYLVVPDAYIQAVAAARRVTSRFMNIADQHTLAKFINDGHFARHLSRMRKIYEERRGALAWSFSRYLDGAARLCHVQAGLQVACEFTIGGLEREILDHLRSAKLELGEVADCCINANLPPMCLLGFAAFKPTELTEATVRMASAIEAFRKLR